jgi:type I restriction enzyme S subunit
MNSILNSNNHVNNICNRWDQVELGNVCEINPPKSKLSRSDDSPTTFVPMAAVDDRKGIIARPEIRPFLEVRKGYTYFEEGDVLFAKITPCMQNGKHAIAKNLIDGIGFASTEFHVIRPGPKITPEWIHYYIRQPSVLKAATCHFSGTVGQQRVSENFLLSLPLPLPSLAKQKCITSLIDSKLALIERARAASEAELQAALSLPAAYLKVVFESPDAHEWPRKRLEQISRLVSGGTPSRGHLEYFIGNIPWVKTLDLNCGVVEKTEELISDDAFAVIRGEILPVGTVMVAMYGGEGTIGKSGILGIEAVTNQAICSILPNPDLFVPEFIHYWLIFIRAKWMEYSSGNRRDPNINKNIISKMDCPLPSVSKQRSLANYLSEKIDMANKLCRNIEEQLESINKMSASLLHQAFTGKL